MIFNINGHHTILGRFKAKWEISNGRSSQVGGVPAVLKFMLAEGCYTEIVLQLLVKH